MGNCKGQCLERGQKELTSVDCTKLSVRIKTWQKEAFSLFDYENAAQVQEQIFMINSNGYLINKNPVEWIESDTTEKEQLCQIKMKNENFYLINNYFQNHVQKLLLQDNEDTHTIGNRTICEKIGNKIWKVVHENGIKIQEGDVIKLGRVKFTIRSIVLQVSNTEQDESQKFESESSSEQISCRVCCSSSNTSQNPLLNPCKCSGSIKYIHLECLKTWLRIKLENRQSENCIVYMWKNLECELCKYNFPPKFKSDNAYYDLVELSKPKDYPYLLMEFSNKQNQQLDWTTNNSNGVYIVKFSNLQEVKVGRSTDTDVRINDISVSRNHAKLVVQDGILFLMDNHSKFGTLQVIRDEKIPIYRGMEVQIGRSLISFF